MIDVSVIIVNFNTFNLTCSCIESILKMTKEVSYEIILVDNDSSECDPTLFSNRFPELILIQSERNLGFAGGNNLGLKAASGRFALLLNSDTELVNDAISKAFSEIASDDSIGVLGGKLLGSDGELQVSGRPFPSIKRELSLLFRLHKIFPSGYYFDGKPNRNKTIIEVDYVWGTFFMFPMQLLNSFPKHQLHDDFFMYVEDIQWCYHIKRKIGKKIVYSFNPQVLHHDGKSDPNTSKNAKYTTTILPNTLRWLAFIGKSRLYIELFSMLHKIRNCMIGEIFE